jgi:hypothetical protein
MKLQAILKNIKERSRLVQGIALGIGLTSLVTWAINAPIALTPIYDGDPLSASVLMGNLTQLQNAVNEINKGFTVSLSGNFPMTCGASKSPTTAEYVAVTGAYLIDRNDGGLNNATGTYTVAAAGAYHFFAEIPAVASEQIERQIFLNGVYMDTPSSSGFSKVKKLNAGDTILLKVGCGNKAGVTADLNAAGFVFGIKKL